MSTPRPLEPISAAEGTSGNSPPQAPVANSSSQVSTAEYQSATKDVSCKFPTEKNSNLTSNNLDHPKENVQTSSKASSLPSDWKSQTFNDDCLDGGGDGLASWEDESSLQFGGSTPPVALWTSSLQNLLNDKDGSDRFKLFLENQGLRQENTMLEFWYACRGLREVPNLTEMINIIWTRYIKNGVIRVSPHTKKCLDENIEKRKFSLSIFDNAQRDVEKYMSETSYHNFVRSEYCTSPHLFDGTECMNASQLPTVHEDSEYQTSLYKPSVRPKCKLPTNNLLTSQKYFVDKTREENVGVFFRRPNTFEQEPFHAAYVQGHTISLQDSEIQSISSGGRTDRSGSYKSGSFDRGNLRRQDANFMRTNAQQNRGAELSLTSNHVPITMKTEVRSGPSPSTNVNEFVCILNKKLELVQQEQENDHKLQQSLLKLSHMDGNSDEIRRQHAENSLPPNLLRNKLREKRILVDNDPNTTDQSILDNHINSWDGPTTASPGSPKPSVPAKEVRTRQLPHMNLPPSYNHKNSSRGRTYLSSSAPHSSVGTPVDGHSTQLQYNKHGHGMRRERGTDLYLSSDSGNVADYHDGSERFPSSIPKSRSIPDYMENHQMNSDGGSSSRRRQVSVNRRSGRRNQADFTDSGVSDSGRSAGAPSTSMKRVTNWLLNCSEASDKDCQKSRGSRSTSHSVAAFSPSFAQKSQQSSSASNSTSMLTSTTPISYLSQELSNLELSRDSPLGQSQSHLVNEKRKNRGTGNGSSSSSKSTGEGGGSNGSTLRKPKSSSSASSGSPMSVIIYHYSDENLPFVVKVKSTVVTLKMFKEHLPKKGKFRYFFKTEDPDVGCVVNLEVTDDEEELPFYEGKVSSQIQQMRDD